MKDKILMLLALCLAFSAYPQTGKIKISATIESRKSDTIYFGLQDNKRFIVVDSKGTFNEQFEGAEGAYYFVNGTDYIKVYLAPGFDLSINADGNNFEKTIAFKGKGAKENTLYAYKNSNSKDTEIAILNGIDNPDTFKKAAADRLVQIHERLNNKEFSPNFQKMMNTELGYDEHNFPTMSDHQFTRQGLENKPLPPFKFESIDGKVITNENLMGKYVLIDIWATWCGPCHKEMPFLNDLAKKLEKKNIAFVSISVDKEADRAKWKSIVKEKSLGGIQLVADKDFESDFIKALGVDFIPRFVIVDPKGMVVNASAKKPEDPLLREELDKLLAE